MSDAPRRLGRVILLNGPPSSGKTTIARALQEVLDPPYWHRSLDHFRLGYLERHWDAARGPWSGPSGRPLFHRLVDGYLHALRAMVLAGHNVLSEAIILPANVDLYLDAFDGIPVFLVGVHCSLEVAEERERSRAPTERYRGVPIDLRVPEFDLVHSHGTYDAAVDTSALSVAVVVAAIRARLDPWPTSTAFDVIRAKRASRSKE